MTLYFLVLHQTAEVLEKDILVLTLVEPMRVAEAEERTAPISLLVEGVAEELGEPDLLLEVLREALEMPELRVKEILEELVDKVPVGLEVQVFLQVLQERR
jgi:hypothetical protein